MEWLVVTFVDGAGDARRFPALNAELHRTEARLQHRIGGVTRVRHARTGRSRHDLIDGGPAAPTRAMTVPAVEIRSVARILEACATPHAGATVRVLLAGTLDAHLESPRD